METTEEVKLYLDKVKDDAGQWYVYLRVNDHILVGEAVTCEEALQAPTSLLFLRLLQGLVLDRE